MRVADCKGLAIQDRGPDCGKSCCCSAILQLFSLPNAQIFLMFVQQHVTHADVLWRIYDVVRALWCCWITCCARPLLATSTFNAGRPFATTEVPHRSMGQQSHSANASSIALNGTALPCTNAQPLPPETCKIVGATRLGGGPPAIVASHAAEKKPNVCCRHKRVFVLPIPRRWALSIFVSQSQCLDRVLADAKQDPISTSSACSSSGASEARPPSATQ